MSSFQYPQHLLHRVIEPQWFPDRLQETTSNLTRLEAAEEAHSLDLQRILTDDSLIAGAVMIGHRGGGGGGITGTPATAGGTTAGNNNNTSSHVGNATTTTSTNTPRRRARRSESSSNASGNGDTGTRTTTSTGSTSDGVGASTGSAMDAAAIGGSPHATTTSSSQPERFWNRSRREDSVIL